MAHRIDTHIHIIPDAYRKVVTEMGDPSGWHVPDWSPASALEFLDKIKTQKAVWSITSPGPCVAGSGSEVRKIVKDCNQETAEICSKQPERFAWFASLPHFDDVEGTISAMDEALKMKPAPSGFVIMTSYGEKIIGDPAYDKIWEAFNARKQIVFVHPSSVLITPKLPAGKLPQPMLDYPHASSRAGVDLILRGHIRKYSSVKVILSHAGGTLPYLFDRVFLALSLPEVGPVFEQTCTNHQWKEDLKKVYFDTAVATSRGQLHCLLEMADPDKILFGSDYPYNGNEVWSWTERFDEMLKRDEFKVLRAANSENAKRLFGW